MCTDAVEPDPPVAASTDDPATEERGPSTWSRRKLLTSGLALGAFAVAPPIRFAPGLPEAGKETPGPEPWVPQTHAIPFRPDWPIPPIVTRAQWGADESRRAADSEFDFDSVVTKLVVHHTVTPNSASSDAAVVRGIFNYHTAIGYWDIAYNFLIGRDGRLYEGRWARNYAAGIAHSGENAAGKNVRAAHATATNVQTVGVALLGDYRGTQPTSAQLETLATFLAWKAARWGLDVNGATRYYDGRVFPTITGHRDVTSTECPGDGAYGLLAGIRSTVAARSRAGVHGYWTLGRQGRVRLVGDLPDVGNPARTGISAPLAGIVAHPSRPGYWAAGVDGRVYAYHYACYYGGLTGRKLSRPIVGIALTPTVRGYWLVGSDGVVYPFGDARTYTASIAARFTRPVVGIVSSLSGKGYWVVAADGTIAAYGDAQLFGSLAGQPLTKPIVGMAATPSGNGYWLLGSGGVVYPFGDAQVMAAKGTAKLTKAAVGMTSNRKGDGYYIADRDGGVFAYGNARYDGSSPDPTLDCVGIALREDL